MPIPLSHMKERLHYAYVNAVAAKAGVNCTKPDNDYGGDLIINDVRMLPSGKYSDTGILFQCQLKATTTCEMYDDYVAYDMDVDDYNKIVTWEGGHMVLVVLDLPKEEYDWIDINENLLWMKRCCYWTFLNGKESKNSNKQRVKIPKNQIFDTVAINYLLQYVRENMGIA